MDGDTVTAKATFTIEANDELHKYMDSKANFIDFGAHSVNTSDLEALQSLYNLTKIIDEKQLGKPEF